MQASHALALTILGSALYLSSLGALQASLTQTELDEAPSPGIVRLSCLDPETKIRTISLGALIDPQAADNSDHPEIVLVVAHGLTAALHNCYVRLGEERLEITEAHLSEDYEPGEIASDWAVLVLDGRFTSARERLPWQPFPLAIADQHIQAEGVVHILRHGNGEPGSACEARIPQSTLKDSEDRDVIIVADCTTFPGMSGAPVVVSVNNAPAVIGVNIGIRYDLTLKDPEWKRAVNVIRLLDAGMDAGLQAAIRSARQTSHP